MVFRPKAKAKGKVKAKGKAGGRTLPRSIGAVSPVSGLADKGKLLKEGGDVYDIDLNVSDAAKNMNKFYRMQVVESNDKSKYWFVQHWGRVGTAGQSQVKGPSGKDEAIKLMTSKFRSKTGKNWADRSRAGPGSGDSAARSGHGNYELTARLKAAGAKTSKTPGSIAISLMWDHSKAKKRNDLDLWVTAPSGEKIGFSHRQSKCKGELDVDRRQECPKPVENIVWPKKAPKGVYTVKVHNFSASHNGAIPFEVGIVKDGGDMETIKKTMPGIPPNEVGKKWVLVKKFTYA